MAEMQKSHYREGERMRTQDQPRPEIRLMNTLLDLRSVVSFFAGHSSHQGMAIHAQNWEPTLLTTGNIRIRIVCLCVIL